MARSAKYVVLVRQSAADVFQVVQTVDASSARAAKLEVAKLVHGGQPRTYVAVPENSWKPETIAPQTETTFRVVEGESDGDGAPEADTEE